MTTTSTRSVRGAPRAKPRASWLRRFAMLYGVLAAAALVAWFVAGDAWWLQPVNLTTFWWLLPAVPLLGLALLLRSPRTATWLAIPAGIWLWSYAGAFLPAAAGTASEALTVATFNTYVQAPDASHVLALVDTHEPDILVLQELFPERQAVLEEQLAGRYPTRVVVQSPGVGGVAVFSRFPLIEERTVGSAGERSRSTAIAVLDVDGAPLQVVPVHLLSPCPTCGTSPVERLELEGDVRRAEIGEVLAALRPDVPAIVAGDLNSGDRSDPYRRLVAAGFTDPQRDVGDGMGFTWPNGGTVPPFLRIDWVLVRGLEPVEAVVGAGGPSDHRPVVVRLARGGA